jgi:hypothetical protein
VFTGCYACGQEGHRRSECPSRSKHPAAAPGLTPAPEVTYPPPPYHAPTAQPSPPTGEYCLAKTALGMQAATDLAGLLSVPCPWCGAGKHSYCKNPATGQRRDIMHEARYVASLRPLPPRPARADLAARQVAEARSLRQASPLP